MVCADNYHLTECERAAIDELPSDCPAFHASAPHAPHWNRLLIAILAADLAIVGLIAWGLVALFGG